MPSRNLWLAWRLVPRVRICGAPIYFQWLVVVIVLPSLVLYRRPTLCLVFAVCQLAVLLIHEFGHADAARRLGYEVVSIHIGPIHGACVIEAPEHESHDVRIHWAGVLAQLIVALPACWLLSMVSPGKLPHVFVALFALGYFNLLIAAINLLPIPGLDGAIAWRALPLMYEEW